jgi:zinc transport system ATP-binding protein
MGESTSDRKVEGSSCMTEVVASIKNLSFRYGANIAVDNISLSIDEGDYIALVGHNGSGKSTLVKLILGILKPSSGNISLFGEDLQNFSDWGKIGYLPQNIGIFNPLFPATVKEIVALGLIARKHFPKKLNSNDRSDVAWALEQMGITELKDKLIGELSGGQIQRTLLARAIVNKPKLLVLDEPVSAVDSETRDEFFDYTSSLNKDKKTAIILITHDVAHSGGFANKLLIMDKHVVFYGSFSEFCSSKEMGGQFGEDFQHTICHQHKKP